MTEQFEEGLDKQIQRRAVEQATGRDLDLLGKVLATAERGQSAYNTLENDEIFRNRILDILGLRA